MIDITGIDLVKFAQAVYELSQPQEISFLHFKKKQLSKTEAHELINENPNKSNPILNMDYVNRRACKMHVRVKNGRWQIHDSWYDHTDEQFRELLDRFGIIHEPLGK